MSSAEREARQRPEEHCPKCGATLDRLAVQCPVCAAALPILGRSRREARGRRYVYGKRKHKLSQEIIWLIVVIIFGLLIVFFVQLLAFMKSRKLLLAPSPQRLVRALPATSDGGVPAGSVSAASAPASPSLRREEETRHADRLRHLCDAGRAAAPGYPGPSPPRLPGDRDLCRSAA